MPGDTDAAWWGAARRYGFDRVEIRVEDASFRDRLPSLKAAMADGACYPSVCVITDRLTGDWNADRRAHAMETMRVFLDVAEELGANEAVTSAS